jgi:putative transcriptional regulator
VDPSFDAPNSTRGSLLVAVPLLDEPTFHRTVIYMLQHSEEGALGLVINRPTNEEHIRGLDQWMHHLSHPQVIFEGGPVMPNTLIAIAAMAFSSDNEGCAPLDHGLCTVDLTLMPDELVEGLTALRVFRGYSGWGAGQLEEELEEGSWLVMPHRSGDVFARHPHQIWRDVLRRSGGPKALLADAPDELSWN